MVEGGSKLHADHPRKWVIFARRFTAAKARYRAKPYISVKMRPLPQVAH